MIPWALPLALCLGLGTFALYWGSRQSACYDDSDPIYYLGDIVLLLAAPGVLIPALIAVARVFGRARSDLWNVLCGMLGLLYLLLAVLLALVVWWTWDGRVYCGGVPYGD